MALGRLLNLSHAWLAQSVELVTLDLGVRSPSPTRGVGLTPKSYLTSLNLRVLNHKVGVPAPVNCKEGMRSRIQRKEAGPGT